MNDAPYAHACHEWDGLEIDVTDPEFDACLCFGLTDDQREAMTFLRNKWLSLRARPAP